MSKAKTAYETSSLRDELFRVGLGAFWRKPRCRNIIIKEFNVFIAEGSSANDSVYFTIDWLKCGAGQDRKMVTQTERILSKDIKKVNQNALVRTQQNGVILVKRFASFGCYDLEMSIHLAAVFIVMAVMECKHQRNSFGYVLYKYGSHVMTSSRKDWM